MEKAYNVKNLSSLVKKSSSKGRKKKLKGNFLSILGTFSVSQKENHIKRSAKIVKGPNQENKGNRSNNT